MNGHDLEPAFTLTTILPLRVHDSLHNVAYQSTDPLLAAPGGGLDRTTVMNNTFRRSPRRAAFEFSPGDRESLARSKGAGEMYRAVRPVTGGLEGGDWRFEAGFTGEDDVDAVRSITSTAGPAL